MMVEFHALINEILTITLFWFKHIILHYYIIYNIYFIVHTMHTIEYYIHNTYHIHTHHLLTEIID